MCVWMDREGAMMEEGEFFAIETFGEGERARARASESGRERARAREREREKERVCVGWMEEGELFAIETLGVYGERGRGRQGEFQATM